MFAIRSMVITLLFLDIVSTITVGQEYTSVPPKNQIQTKNIIGEIAAVPEKQKFKEYHIQPEVGKPMPVFTLTNIAHYKASKATLPDFRGKWLFLDFWFARCISCIKSFPKIDSFQRKFSDKAQFILVGQNNGKYNKGIEKMYERMRKSKGYVLPTAYDSILFKNWEINAMPHIIIINPQGIVVARTNGFDMTTEKLDSLFKGYPQKFIDRASEPPKFDTLTEGKNINSISKALLKRSIISKYSNESMFLPDIDYQLRSNLSRKGYRAIGMTLSQFYTLAYFGLPIVTRKRDSFAYRNFYPFPKLEIKDSSAFVTNYSSTGLYNYTLIVPKNKESKSDIMKFMQADLQSCFGFEARIEKHKMMIYKLVAGPNATLKLQSQGGRSYNSSSEEGSSSAFGFSIKNLPMKVLITKLYMYLPGVKYFSKIPFFDETGLELNIDIDINTELSNISSLKKELEKYDLKLIEEYRDYQVIVIRDISTNKNATL